MNKESNPMVNIMRRPCIQEDEGRHFFVKRLPQDEAEQWIIQQEGKYFRPSDYYITEEKFSASHE